MENQENLSLRGIATQSSTSHGGVASRAIDGNTSGQWGHGTVTHTHGQHNAWWKLYLDSLSSISKVVVWNRMDCCTGRLSNSNVDVLDDEGNVVETRVIGDTHNIEVITLDFGNVVGSAVRIQLHGRNALSLAEVQVFGVSLGDTLENLSLHGTASQSSTSHGGVAERAIDGNPSGKWGDGSVTHTDTQQNAWWKVDLYSLARITRVVVWNRMDCCSNRLSNSNVDVLDDEGNIIETREIGNSGGVEVIPLFFDSVVGSAVRIQLQGRNPLSLAEVQVLGEYVSRSPALVTQSSTASNFDLETTVSDTSLMSPTVSPKAMPTMPTGFSCVDSPLDVVAPTGNVGCSVVAKNLSSCSFPGAGSHCPFTCSKCSEYQCSDSELEFVYGNDSYFCSVLKLVKEKDRKNYCRLEAVYSTCRASCKVCG